MSPTPFDVDSDIFAVNEKGEIFIVAPDKSAQTLVTVYSEKNGEKLRTIIPGSFKTAKSMGEVIKSTQFGIKLDKANNIYLLSSFTRRIKKYSPSGAPIWDQPIANEMLDQWIKSGSDWGLTESKGHIRIKGLIWGFEVTENGAVFISFIGGGCFLDSNGKLIALFSSLSKKTIKKNALLIGCESSIESFYIRSIPDKLRSLL